jgi:cation transport regulator ChaC
MRTLQDLEVLERYLSEEELKEVAKDVARELFRSSLGGKNPHRRTNLDYYIGQGALQAVEEYMVDFDKEELASNLKARTKTIIKGMSVYNLPDNYIQIAKDEIVLMILSMEKNILIHIGHFLNF